MKAAARSYIVKDVDVVIQHPMNDVRQQINILIINDIWFIMNDEYQITNDKWQMMNNVATVISKGP